GPIETTFNLDFSTSEKLTGKISSKYDNYSVDLSRPGKTLERRETFPIDKVRLSSAFDLTEFYSKKFINYGPSFQVLTQVGLSEDSQVWTTCPIRSMTRTGSRNFDILTTFYEACIQTAATKCLVEESGLALPSGIEDVTYFQENLEEIAYITTGDLKNGSSPHLFSTDVFAYNKNGNLVAKMTRVQLKKFVQLKEFPLLVQKSNLALVL
ncbi:MAG: polyketide synthase dehydratase domain-containing protein, partial [Bdellovibrionales bacterium]|nr:polyketide synthase dehydratase domain-containing protein [Bdellovibrionales bacterium]